MANAPQNNVQNKVTKLAGKVTLSVAQSEFMRFMNLMDLDVDESKLDDEDLTSFLKTKRRLIRAIQKGSLVINENGEAVYTPSNSASKYQDAITFHEQSGAALMAFDGKKRNQNVSASFSVMGAMCRVHPSTFAGLVGVDFKACMGIFALLMD